MVKQFNDVSEVSFHLGFGGGVGEEGALVIGQSKLETELQGLQFCWYVVKGVTFLTIPNDPVFNTTKYKNTY